MRRDLKKAQALAKDCADLVVSSVVEAGNEVPESLRAELEEGFAEVVLRFLDRLARPGPRGELATLWASLTERAAVRSEDLPQRFRQWVKQGFLSQQEYEAVSQLIRGEEPELPPGVDPQTFMLKVSSLLLRFRASKRR
ncbi:hypothetical protein HRbin39_00041 [bacterium HR39]|nr:hypothetical protein HRbin39_00041 [bacterium HR39]